MSKRNGSFSLRGAVEKIFTGLFATAILAFVASGTIAMCLPGVVVV